MKKMLRTSAFILATVILLTGCNTGSSATSSKINTQYANVGMPDSLKITSSSFFNEGEVDTFEMRDAWTKAMSDKYGIEITVLSPDVTYYSTVITEAIEGTTSGIMDVVLADTVLYLKNKNLLLPLEDYLSANKAWNALPEKMRKMYEYDGHIWAVPSGFELTQPVRAFRQDWLDNVGLKAPKTLDELYKVLEAFRDNDPDKDGDVTNSIPLSGDKGLGWAKDILAAFDVNISSSGLLPYAYNAEKGCYEDAFLKPEAVQAFEYLKKMYTENLIDKEIFAETANFGYNLSQGYIGTYLTNAGDAKYYESMNLMQSLNPSTVYDPNDPQDWVTMTGLYTEVAALTGNKDKNLTPAAYYGSPYVLLANTEKPAETINFFVDMLFGSNKNYLNALVGLEDNYSISSGNVIKMKYSDEANNVYYPLASLVGYIEGLHPRSEYTIVKSQSAQAISNKKEINNYLKDFSTEALDKKLLYVIDSNVTTPQSATLTEQMNNAMTEFKNCFSDAISDPNTTVEKALAAYRTNMKKYDGQKILDESNAAIGAKSTQKY